MGPSELLSRDACLLKIKIREGDGVDSAEAMDLLANDSGGVGGGDGEEQLICGGVSRIEGEEGETCDRDGVLVNGHIFNGWMVLAEYPLRS
ncbi:hypothetical protein QJS04_geneDACA006312 [Acorus gramineus]|uniref:Uncharacterized protein n=1 Tax=Acorus gramineus TaxID=55184 RepID=A0AAV9AX43_ACOGR|nr:hypothetical protein QJS04_geneDACA006312 [Acorus gramineus]